MGKFETKQFLPLLVLGLLTRTTSTNNVSTTNEIRNPKVSGRIVKLYSGTRPEPILCAQDGFQADPLNCAVFYRCVKGSNEKYTVFKYQCGPGTIYDPDTEICNHPRSTKRVNCGGYAPSSSEMINENEIEGSRHEIPSSSSAYYDQNSKKRDLTTFVTKMPWFASTDHIISSSLSADLWLNTNSQYQKVTRSPVPHQPRSQTGEQCTSEGFMGDTENCQKFYRCVSNGRSGYIKYEFSCSELTIWDDETQSCNHAYAVRNIRCGRGNVEDIHHKSSLNNEKDSNPTKTIQSQTQISYGSKVNQVQTQISNGPVIQNQTQINYGDRLNEKTNSYSNQNQTQISNGSAVSQTQTQISHGENVFQTQLQIDHSKSSSQSQTQIHEATTTGSDSVQDNKTQKPSNGKPVKDNECVESGFMADSNDCKKFYRCVDNGRSGYIKYEFACGEGTVWDPNTQACNHEWAVKDCRNKTPSSTTSEMTTTLSTQFSSTVKTTTEHENGNNANQAQQQTSTVKNDPEKPLTSSTTESSTTSKASSTTISSTANNVTMERSCTSSGFMGDAADCKKFYRCVDNGNGGFTKYEYKCGEGTVWDPQLETCNHAWAVENCGKGTTDKYPTDSTTQADEGSGQVTPGNTDKPVESTMTSTASSSSTMSTTISQSETPADNICMSDGFTGDKSNCKKFYRCVDNGKGRYIRYEFTCGENTIWDQSIQACNHPSPENNCKSSEMSTSTEKPQSQSETTTHKEIPNESPSTTSTMSSNDNQCSSEGFYANQNDCKKFYRCVNNGKDGFTKYDFTCGDGTIWVQEIQACDHNNNISNCSMISSSSAPPNSEEQHQTTTVRSSTTVQATNPEREKDKTPNDSSDKCQNEGFYPDKEDCTKFYRCVDNGQGGFTKYNFACGDGTAWDSSIQACNHVNDVKNCQNKGEQNVSSPAKCNETVSHTTEATSTNQTTTTESSMENKQPASKSNCKEEGYFGDSSNCKKFYRCVDDGKGGLTMFNYTCGEGTIWDQDILACNHPRDVQNPSCNNTSSNTESSSASPTTTTTTTTTTISSSSTNSESSSSSTTENSANCSQSSTQEPQNKNVNCTKAGFYADPDDCKKFYRCVDWDNNGQRFSVFHFDCGEGTIWDPELQTCNHENSVYPPRECSKKQTQAQNSTDKTTTSTTTSTTSPSTTPPCSTQESTTSNDTTSTTQESSTTDSSTTQQATTTEKSTTQQATTTQQSTTQKSTTTEKSTTEESTTQTTTENSTTQESTTQTTTDKSTTQQSSTTEESTTQQTSTTQNSTTQQSGSTEESTTQPTSTTQDSSTQQSSTTEESSTSTQTTTEQSTTTQEETSSTESSSTEKSTTQQSTTEQTTTATDSSTTTEQSLDSTTTESNQESTTEASSSDSKCPKTDGDQNVYVCPTSFRRHPKYCNMFYQCTEDSNSHDLKIAVFKCPNNTIYDESKTQCVEKDKAEKKCDGEIAEKRRVKRLGTNFKDPIVASKERHDCAVSGYFPFEKSECSPGFLKCDKTQTGELRGYVYQCPEGYVYWSISKRCEARSNVSDCKLSANDWSGRQEIPIERKNVAP